MRVRGMYLKKNKNIFYLVFFIILLNNNCFAQNSLTKKAINYIEMLNNFSGSFIQNDESSISEGSIFIGLERVRVEYHTPTKILIVLDKNKAMYYNYDLDEDEFFDPRDSSAGFFFEIFNNPNFFIDAKVVSKDNFLILQKNGISENGNYEIEIFFENNPMIIRKVKMLIDGSYLNLSIYNHNYNEKFNENMFKLINPSFFE